MTGRMDGWIEGGMDGRMDGWMDGRTDARMDGWMDGWMCLEKYDPAVFFELVLHGMLLLLRVGLVLCSERLSACLLLFTFKTLCVCVCACFSACPFSPSGMSCRHSAMYVLMPVWMHVLL